MKKLDFKAILVAIFLIIVSILSFKYWEILSVQIMNTLNSKYLTITWWITLIVTTIIHYQRNKNNQTNQISENEGFDKPISYFQFVVTLGAIGSSIQILAREVFAFYSFPELCKTNSFKGFDIASFIIVIIVLVSYCYNKFIPVLQETYVQKIKIQIDHK